MKSITTKAVSAALTLSLVSSFGFTSLANAAAAAGSAPVKDGKATTGSAATKQTTAQNSATLKATIAKGDADITKRLTSLSTMGTKISALKNVTNDEKTSLTKEVTDSKNGLTTLKGTIDADTTVAKAKSDSGLIFTTYRVYAIVLPKISIIKAADDQLAKETKLTTFANGLGVAAANLNQTAKQADALAVMNLKIAAANQLSKSVDTEALQLQPNDYNSNHQVLTTYYVNLKTAQADNVAAHADGVAIAKSLYPSVTF